MVDVGQLDVYGNADVGGGGFDVGGFDDGGDVGGFADLVGEVASKDDLADRVAPGKAGGGVDGEAEEDLILEGEEGFIGGGEEGDYYNVGGQGEEQGGGDAVERK